MKRILLCLSVLLATMQLMAAPVDMITAQKSAQRFVNQHLYGGSLRAPIAGQMKLAHAETNSKMLDRAVYYIFNSSNGYVIVAGDDRAETILGYGDAPIDINAIPCNMKAWLATYKEQIEYLQAHEGMQVQTPSRSTVCAGGGEILPQRRPRERGRSGHGPRPLPPHQQAGDVRLQCG